MAGTEEIDIRIGKEEVEKGELVDLEGKFDIDKFLAKYKVAVGIGLVGLLLIGLGSLIYFKMFQPQEKIEIISEEEVSQSIYCDIAGGVERPGMYELTSGSRVEDLLIKAGGLSAEADREWVERNLNRAQKLVDGAKIYIPSVGQTTENIEQSGGQVVGSSTNITAKIDINTASASELDTLWGIGTVRAQDIIDNRPYQSVGELQTKKIIPSNVYEKIKDQISVY